MILIPEVLTQHICCVGLFGMPILNHRDYRKAKARLEQLKSALRPDIAFQEIASGWSSENADARRVALGDEFERLKQDVQEYEKLKGQQSIEGVLEANDLGFIPIVGRIVRGLSQRQLAETLKLKEQQIQRYERERYRSISLVRYKKILEALNIEMQARLGAGDESRSTEEDTLHTLTFRPEVIAEIEKRGWFETSEIGSDEVQTLLSTYVQEGIQLSNGPALHRKSFRDTGDFDEPALIAWKARILKVAKSLRPSIKAKFNTLDISWIQTLVALSVERDGPMRAVDFLTERGIIVVVEPHLSRTRLDGAALKLLDGTPVIGLTLRYDRIDYFWFTLLHELAHIILHSTRGLEEGFLDNLQILDSSDREKEADSFAKSAFIPDEVWATAPARFAKSIDIVKKFAASRGIHPAIVAGRIRNERGDYSIFSNLVGDGEVRQQFLRTGQERNGR